MKGFRLQNVRVELGGRPVLDDVSLEIEAGEQVGIIGPSGAGKTTLLRLLIGAVRPDAGHVEVAGRDLAELSPEALRALSPAELERAAQELRDEIVQRVSRTGGHLASSLGAVELITAIHYVFDTPRDRLVLDVGHQGYPHKMLTGRRHGFEDIGKEGGIAKFLRRSESPYDHFGAGHAGTSISASDRPSF